MGNERVAPSLNLLVILAENPDRLCRFYSALGLHFVREQHGAGPIHHAAQLGESVFEIYPTAGHESSTLGARLGFNVPSLERALQAVHAVRGWRNRGTCGSVCPVVCQC